ncbi:MAG: hypothetical protein K2I53_14955 [Lachnospiraceae bacterium]|nr:hypothetical protein [Lachnospiraceae bacterium]
MIYNDRLMGYKTINTTNSTAELLAKQMRSADKLKMTKMEGTADPDSFAAKLKRADEYAASGEHYSANDSIGIMLRQMDEPTAGNPVTQDFWHNGAHISICKDALYGNSITIGGSSNPDWVHVDTSVGTVNVDLNDMTSLMKCLDLFSPEDLNAILRKIQEVKQSREALNQIDRMQDELVKNGRDQKKEGGEDSSGQSVGEAVGVVSAEEARGIEENREKKFIG